MKLVTKAIEQKLIKNYNLPDERKKDLKPVVKFFTPFAQCTWLITEYAPEYNEFFGLCDLGLGFPELGYVSREEIEFVRKLGLNDIERDRGFKADKTLAEYAEIARVRGMIIA